MSAAAVDREVARRWLGRMMLIRRFEEKSAEMYQSQKIRGFLHLCNGQEAVAVGAVEALREEDWLVSTYREHGHALARGITPRAVMSEMYGKVEGCSRGRGGSMHVFDRGARFVGGNGIVGGALPLAVGLALGDRVVGRNGISAVIFGDGAVAEGAFHESMNLASLWRLPVLFVCENNQYAMGTAIERYQAQRDLVLKAAGYGIPGASVDGMDVAAAAEAASRAAAEVRAGHGPRFLELRTYRFRAHSMFDADKYRDKAEIERWKLRDPIALFSAFVQERGLLDGAEIAALDEAAMREVDDAAAFAEAGHFEPASEVGRFVYSERATP